MKYRFMRRVRYEMNALTRLTAAEVFAKRQIRCTAHLIFMDVSNSLIGTMQMKREVDLP